MAGMLPDDLMEEIFVRLPSRAAGRLRWSCKHWLALTYDPYFLRRFYALHPSPPVAGLFMNYFGSRGVVFLPFTGVWKYLSSVYIPDPPSMRFPPQVLVCCNGLILLRCYGFSGLIHFVCNPTARTIHVIPKPDIPAAKGCFVIPYALAFDAGASDEFTIVSIDHSYPPNIFHTYSSTTREWRLSAAAFIPTPEDEQFTSLSDGVYFKGSMYWIHGNMCSLRVLNMAEERLSSIPLPHIPENASNTFIQDLSASGGHLHVMIEYCQNQHDRLSMVTPFYVWEMNPDSSSWTLLYSFTSMFKDCPFNSNKYMTPWMFLRGEGEEKQDMLLFHISMGPLLLYNITDHTFKEIETPQDWDPCRSSSKHVFRYLPF